MAYLLAFGTLLASLLACLGYGWVGLRLLRVARAEPLRFVYALALGMGVLAYTVLGLGLAGWLHRPLLAALVAVGWLPAAGALLERRKLFTRRDEAADRPSPAGRWLALGLYGCLGLLFLTTLLFVLRPVDELDWDSLSYHLAAPKLYLRHARIFLIGYDSHTNFPFTMEMLYTLGLAFGGAPAARLFHWAAGWLAVLAVSAWTSRLRIDGQPLPPWTGPAAGALFASMPIVLWMLGTAYVDLGTALFQFLALAALLDAVHFSGGRPEIRPEGAALAGILTGLALGTKMTALLQFGLLGLGLLAVVARAAGPERRALQATLLFGTAAVLVGCPWYVKSWLWTHNPVYPFFYGLFPHSFSWTPQAAEAYAVEQRSFGLGRGPDAAGKLLWNLALHAREFYINHRTLIGDKLGSLGPAWAGLLPLVFWTRRLPWQCWAALAYSGASLGAWFFLSQQSRYLVPQFAPLAAVAAVTLAALPSGPLRIGAGCFTGLTLALNFGMVAPLVEPSVAVLSGQMTEREYLRGNLRGLYEAAEYVNALPADTRIGLYQETRGFYFDRDYFWANPLQHDMIPYESLRDGDELVRTLRRFGITHVLVNYAFCQGVEGSRWYQLLMDGIRRGSLKEVFRSQAGGAGQLPVSVYRLQ